MKKSKKLNKNKVILISGTRKGIGRFLAEYYTHKGLQVVGCSRRGIDYELENYQHFCADVSNESDVKKIMMAVRKDYQRLDILINNAGVASMNHILLTPLKTVHDLLNTNFIGTFLFCREAAKLMRKNSYGRIVNFTTVAAPLKLEGEAIYASSKAAVVSLTKILAKELAEFGITVNGIGPTPIKTDLIKNVPQEKIKELIRQQAIKRYGDFKDIANVVDFFISPESDFVTSQIVYLGGVS
jgi:3-oxoacyl-[acyl-carrier protein] reductase